MNRYVLGIDPSGAYDEGKGTTGWCVYDRKKKAVIEVGAIFATGHDSAHAYWQAHLHLILRKNTFYDGVAVSIEDFVLYKSTAQSLTNSRMETCQLLGIIKQTCYTKHIRYYIRPAVAVKKRWSNEILVHKGILYFNRGHHYVDCVHGRILSDHEIDSIRHAVHCAYFEIKEEEQT